MSCQNAALTARSRPVENVVENPPKRRWKAFICPQCRAVFRFASDHKDDGVICHNCHHLLRITKGPQTSFAKLDQAATPPVKRRSSSSHQSKSRPKSSPKGLTIFLVFFFLLSAATAIYFLSR